MSYFGLIDNNNMKHYKYKQTPVPYQFMKPWIKWDTQEICPNSKVGGIYFAVNSDIGFLRESCIMGKTFFASGCHLHTQQGQSLYEGAFIYRTHAIITRSWILTIHKGRIFRKNFVDFQKLGNKYTSRGL